jgi:hypothetical protein
MRRTSTVATPQRLCIQGRRSADRPLRRRAEWRHAGIFVASRMHRQRWRTAGHLSSLLHRCPPLAGPPMRHSDGGPAVQPLARNRASGLRKRKQAGTAGGLKPPGRRPMLDCSTAHGQALFGSRPLRLPWTASRSISGPSFLYSSLIFASSSSTVEGSTFALRSPDRRTDACA